MNRASSGITRSSMSRADDREPSRDSFQALTQRRKAMAAAGGREQNGGEQIRGSQAAPPRGRNRMAQYRLISADSHVSEPPDLWATRCDKQYRERAPHLVTNPPGKEGAYFYYEGHSLHPIGIGLGAGKSPEELKEFLTKATYADARPGGWDPAERIKDNAVDGVEGDVLYTTLGFRIFWLKDAGLQADCFRVYNDWLAEFVSHAPDKMAGLALISLYDPKAGARELERCAKMGLKGAMIWCSPPQEQPYSSDVYDPFWAAAQEMNMPISLHAITGMGIESQWNWGERYMRTTVLGYEVEKSFSVLIFSGVLDRFPNLQIVSAENNIGWIPYYLQRMDRVAARSRAAAGFTQQLKPSEYFQRQMWATYIDDYVGVANRRFIGVDRIMWSSDYPHQASSWPHSQEVVARDFKEASPDEVFKITRGNVARLYGFAV